MKQYLLLVLTDVASTGKTAKQSGTVGDRSADYAVDGNNNNTNPGSCAAAFLFYDELSTAYGIPAWWQVNLGDFYLVKAITVYFPITGLGAYKQSESENTR